MLGSGDAECGGAAEGHLCWCRLAFWREKECRLHGVQMAYVECVERKDGFEFVTRGLMWDVEEWGCGGTAAASCTDVG